MALDFGKLNFSVSFNPTSAFPLDARSYFESYAEAEAAARSAVAVGSADSTYYFGQTLIVVENKTAIFYIIQPDGTLQRVAAGDDVKVTVNPSLFEYDEDGNLSLKGFNSAEFGSYFSLGEDGTISWVKPDFYTKTETDEKIAEAVSKADHLKRKVVTSLIEAQNYVSNNADGDQYVYMVPSDKDDANDKYDEYIVILVDGKKVLEKVGSWGVDLSDYATLEDLNQKVDKEIGARLITAREIEKLNSLENSPVKSVDETKFTIDEDGELGLNIDTEDVNGLDNALASKVDKKEGWILLSPTNQEKLDKLNISGGQLEISGTVNAANVTGLSEWITDNGSTYIQGLTANNLSSDLADKIDFITSVDTSVFQVLNGKLKLSPVDGSRLITEDEISLLERVAAGSLDNFIRSVDQGVFSVSGQGKLTLTAVPNSALVTTVGDLTQLITYGDNNDTTIVNEINALYEMLSWRDMD